VVVTVTFVAMCDLPLVGRHFHILNRIRDIEFAYFKNDLKTDVDPVYRRSQVQCHHGNPIFPIEILFY